MEYGSLELQKCFLGICVSCSAFGGLCSDRERYRPVSKTS